MHNKILKFLILKKYTNINKKIILRNLKKKKLNIFY